MAVLKKLALQTRKQPLLAETIKRRLCGPQVTIPNEADVVIIGGGSLGCNTLYHLAQKGVTNAVLIEKDKLTAGTTWHSAGLLWRLRPSDVDIQLLNHTRNLLLNLQAESEVDPGWTNNGGLFIANNKVRLDEYKRLHTLGKAFNVESYILSPEETQQLYPLINVSDIYGSLYSPGDGLIDPNSFCHALARSATKSGAKVIENCSVTELLTQTNSMGTTEIQGVKTNLGTIKTNCIVNCTGAWANHISEKLGIHTPLVAMKHAYITTERVEGVMGMPNVRDHDASVYLKVQGDSLHIGGYEKNPMFWEKVESDFSFGLFELDWDVFGIHIEGAINRVPAVEQVGIKSTVCGPESFTPDHKPIMGEDPRVRGFFHGCGFNSAGMMLGGGCGNELAKWIIHGKPDLDMYSFDVRRFCPKVSSDVNWVKEKSHEAYVKNYAVVYPHDEPLAGRNSKKDPLHKILMDRGCVFQERQGWERPGWFTMHPPVPIKPYDWYGAYNNPTHEEYGYKERLILDYTFDYPKLIENVRSECLITRYSAALFNMSYFGKFYLGGPESQAAADWIFSNNMTSSPGKTVYTCMLNQDAGIEADLTVSILQNEELDSCLNPFGEERSFYIAAAGGSAYYSLSHIQKAIQDQGLKNVTLKNMTEDMGLLSLQGPKSKEILERITNQDLSNDAIPFSCHKIIDVAGSKVRILRVSFVGELGYELHIPKRDCVKVYEELMRAGQDLGLIDAGYRAMDALSIEKGYPHWHQELRPDDTPLEAGLMFTCKLKSETNFLGRQSLERKKETGAIKKKVCFTTDRKDVNLLGFEVIYRDNELVGYIRRADYGYHIDKPVAYGYIHHPQNQKITNAWLKEGMYELESMGQRMSAHLHLRSPFDPENKRLQGDYDFTLPQHLVTEESMILKC